MKSGKENIHTHHTITMHIVAGSSKVTMREVTEISRDKSNVNITQDKGMVIKKVCFMTKLRTIP